MVSAFLIRAASARSGELLSLPPPVIVKFPLDLSGDALRLVLEHFENGGDPGVSPPGPWPRPYLEASRRNSAEFPKKRKSVGAPTIDNLGIVFSVRARDPGLARGTLCAWGIGANWRRMSRHSARIVRASSRTAISQRSARRGCGRRAFGAGRRSGWCGGGRARPGTGRPPAARSGSTGP